ncbi:cytochrome b/b6 domain-containing protein [Thalassomonas sp. M1454]|uniref:cytochrome b/b6 domain-containing protein n=1 Tax=Thalassomonas sp. M1454 TaxID=2594477 RepID=UPI00117FDFFE|nr:cytochrome b/b6 domain-containing protein [Thalassomonas sp. M1454]TRX56612.1 cytochrome b/b6 domain-containing protein [Thalassomonas sp. M1454]
MALQPIYVWSKKIRIFHWLNVISILTLIILGLFILNAKTFGVSTDGKVLLKTIHTIVGYVFFTNLVIRIVFGFIGKGYERWGKTLAFNKGFIEDLKSHSNEPFKASKGHNPFGKLMITALYLFMLIQGVTGLVIAGTDIYYPPFGQHFATSIAQDKSKVALIKPYSKENVDQNAYKAMRELRTPFIKTHVFSFYVITVLLILHILAVVIMELKTRNSIISAMFSGYKHLPKE